MCKVNSSLYTQKLPDSRREVGGQTHWVPNTDVYKTSEGLVINVELAGLRQEDVEIAVEGNRLLITGQRRDGVRGRGIKFLVMEVNYGVFECVIEIPPGYELGRTKADYRNGFLRVEVPSAIRPSSSKTIPISLPEDK
jgi:HSP20 family protein